MHPFLINDNSPGLVCRYMVNHKGIKEVHLFDCFSDMKGFIDTQYKLYDVDPIFHKTCIGPANEIVNDLKGQPVAEFKTFADAYDWDTVPPLGAAMKIDVEGSEWAVFNQMLEKRVNILNEKAAILDLEIHWCMPRHGLLGEAQRDAILNHLRRFKRFFYITGRWADLGEEFKTTGGYENGGCNLKDGQYQMMSLSYVNKALWSTPVAQVDAKRGNRGV